MTSRQYSGHFGSRKSLKVTLIVSSITLFTVYTVVSVQLATWRQGILALCAMLILGSQEGLAWRAL